MDLPSARESIFVSHVNGDAAAEKVLARLTEKLCDALGAGHASYKIVWDRQSIFPSDDWRDRIFQWLWDCPAAVILVSLDAFLSSKPWVSSETFFLSVRRKQADASGGTVIIVPVVIGTAIEKLTTTQTFEPSNLREIAYIHCDDPSD